MMKKRRWRSGFTLSETLITLAILAVVTAGGAAVTGSVLGSRMELLETADAQILASTVMESLADEIRFGQNIRLDSTGKTVTLNSAHFGMNASFSVDAGRVVATGDSIGSGVSEDLLTTGAYTSLKVAGLAFEDDGDGIKISLKVESSRKTEPLWDDTLTVVPLNGYSFS